MTTLQRLCLVSLVGLIFTSCSEPRARIRDPGEDSIVGDTRAGAAVYRNVIDQGLKDLSDQYRAQTRGQVTFTKIKVAFMGVDNRTNEELGSWRQQINDIINRAVNRSGDFQDISFERFIKPALNRARVSPENLVIPADRRKLMEVLEQSGTPVDAFLFASLSQGDTRGGGLRQSDYILTFELMNAGDGTRLMSHGEISKEYR